VQCNTATIAFIRRNDEAASVYVAHSAITGLVKVGLATDVAERISTLRRLGCGGVTDWSIEQEIHCDRAGQVEFAAHAALEPWRARRSYARNGEVVECKELFLCSTQEACRAVANVLRHHSSARIAAA
jgi:hypothetical protein